MIVAGDRGGQAAELGQLRPMGSDPGDRRCAQGLGLDRPLGEHADRPVGAGESRLGAYRLRPGITDLALGAGEKAPDRLPGRRDGFEGHSDQAFQAHARCR